jgi:hypothetical protein
VAFFVLVVLATSAAVAAAEPGLVPRQAQLACGPVVVLANAQCYGTTTLCLRETLTFRRLEGSTTLAPHVHTHNYPAPSRGTLTALDYRATSWACTPGKGGGSYVAVLMVRTGSTDCAECQYLRLYHPSGNLIATTLKFDASGRATGDEKGTILVQKVLGRSWPEGLKIIYDR